MRRSEIIGRLIPIAVSMIALSLMIYYQTLYLALILATWLGFCLGVFYCRAGLVREPTRQYDHDAHSDILLPRDHWYTKVWMAEHEARYKEWDT